MDNGFLTSSPSMLSFVHLGLQIFIGLLIVRIVRCRGENIGVLRREYWGLGYYDVRIISLLLLFRHVVVTLVAWKKNKRL